MHPNIELSLTVEFEELFSLRDRVRHIADRVRSRFIAGGLTDQFAVEVFDEELELRGPEGSRLAVRLDNFHLELTGASSDLQVHLLAGILLDEAEVFRLTSVEAGFSITLQMERELGLDLVAKAFAPVTPGGDEPMLDRRFSLTWEWGTATTGFSFLASDTEDREMYLSLKAHEGYLTLPELSSGEWISEQSRRFDALVSRFLVQMGWQG